MHDTFQFLQRTPNNDLNVLFNYLSTFRNKIRECLTCKRVISAQEDFLSMKRDVGELKRREGETEKVTNTAQLSSSSFCNGR